MALEKAVLKEQKSFVEKQLTESKIVFENAANEILKKQSENFKDANKSEMGNILMPLKETIKNYQEAVASFNKEQREKNSALDYAIKDAAKLNQRLADEAANLATALQNKKLQGSWGEMVLERVLEWAGLKEGVEYEKQSFFKNDDNERQYPDFIIKLPKERKVIIDSKMSIENYKRWTNEADEALKTQFLENHIKDIKKHIDELSAKEYQKLLKEEGLDFVIMFVPIEYAYFAALEKDDSLNEYAGKRKVAIATASSLFPILKVVENLWRIERSNKNTEEIIKSGEEMHKRVDAFLAEMIKLESAISQSQKVYESAMTKLQGGQGIIKSAVKLEALGLKYQKSLKNNVNEEEKLSIKPPQIEE
jgi:DNA recombination protein RmuC